VDPDAAVAAIALALGQVAAAERSGFEQVRVHSPAVDHQWFSIVVGHHTPPLGAIAFKAV
jgi:hypothetical protein